MSFLRLRSSSKVRDFEPWPNVRTNNHLPAAGAMCFGAPVITSQDPALCEVTGGSALHVAADRDSRVAAIVEAFAPAGSAQAAHDGAHVVRRRT